MIFRSLAALFTIVFATQRPMLVVGENKSANKVAMTGPAGGPCAGKRLTCVFRGGRRAGVYCYVRGYVGELGGD